MLSEEEWDRFLKYIDAYVLPFYCVEEYMVGWLGGLSHVSQKAF